MASCGEQLVKMLEAYGVELVFGIPGVHTIELYRGVAASGLRHVTPRHEQGAGFMADGYARASGKVAACFVITGPGLTNIATAMGQALADSIPMLVISSVNRTGALGLGEGRLHELPDQRALANQVARFSHTLLTVDDLPQVLARAFTVFRSQRPGPVHIEIPIDVIAAPADHVDIAARVIPSPPGPAAESVTLAVAELRSSERPLVVVGGGAVDAGVAITALAEQLSAPVLNTVNAKGVIPPDHPLAVGGSPSSEPVRRLLQDADVVLAFGTEFGETDYDLFFTGAPTIGGTLIRVDIDPLQLTRNVPADLPIIGDARRTAEALLAVLQMERVAPAAGAARAEAARTELRALVDAGYQRFFDSLQAALPDVVIAGDSTQPTYFAWLHYETAAPRRYFHSASGFGTLGYAIPAAVGAALGCPDVPVVGLIGDGASQFTVGEIASAVEAQVDVILLVWNNHGYAEIKRFMTEAEVEPVGVDLHTPDFVALGEAFGARAQRVGDFDALKAALIAARDAGGVHLIEVMQQPLVGEDPKLIADS